MTSGGKTLAEAMAALSTEEPPFEYDRVWISASVYYFRTCPKCKQEVPAVGNTGRCIDCEDKRRRYEEDKVRKLQAVAELRVEH